MDIITLPMPPCCVNTYVIFDGKSAVVVDPGEDVAQMEKVLRARDAKPEYVLVTHGHFDHVCGVAAMQKIGATVCMSKVDYDNLDALNRPFGYYIEPFEPDVPLSNEQTVKWMGHEFCVISTPGHTPGGVCYMLDNSIIFSGDTLFRLSVGRTDFPFGSLSELMNSVKKLFILSGNYTVYPGHNEATDLDYERKNNPYVH